MSTKEKICPTCRKIFTTHANLKKHMARKNPCVVAELTDGIETQNKKFKCNRCESSFRTSQKLTSHLNRKFPCELKNPSPEEIELRLLFEQLQEKNKQQQIQIDKLENKSTITNNTANNINSNNTTNNIIIHSYGNEDMSHITENMYKQCFQVVYKSVEKLFDMKHFSKDMKQNHNLYITNMNSNHMMMLTNEKWGLVEKAETLDNMYEDIRENLSDAFNELRDKDRVDAVMEKQFSSFADDYKVDEDENEERAKKESCKKMAYLAFNNRQFAINAQRQLKNKTK
jgi:hypothetical protein